MKRIKEFWAALIAPHPAVEIRRKWFCGELKLDKITDEELVTCYEYASGRFANFDFWRALRREAERRRGEPKA